MQSLIGIAPQYASGFLITTVTSVVAALLALVYRYVCLWENKKRDKLGAEAFDHAYDDDLTDMKVGRILLIQIEYSLTRLAESTVQIPSVIHQRHN
jgi:hypothetical protein